MDISLSAFTASSTAASMPFFTSIGFAPAATFFMPSRIIAWARRVAVVVPSPATSLVLMETSFTSCAPIFSKGSSSSISLAIVTPSLVMRGAPYFLSSTTLRPLGPRVILTVSARAFIPASRALRASSPYLSCFAIVFFSFYSEFDIIQQLQVCRSGVLSYIPRRPALPRCRHSWR